MSLAYLAHRKCVYISIHYYYHSLNLPGSETKACCRWSSGEGLSSKHGYDRTKWDCWILLLTWILSTQSLLTGAAQFSFQTVLSSFLSGQDPLTSSPSLLSWFSASTFKFTHLESLSASWVPSLHLYWSSHPIRYSWDKRSPLGK